MRKAISAALVAGFVAATARPVSAGTFGSRTPLVHAAAAETSLGTAPDGSARVLLPDGSRIIVQKNGLGVRVDASGRVLHAVDVVRPVGYKSAMGDDGPDAVAIAQRLALQRRRFAVPGEVIVVFRDSFDAHSLSGALRERGALGANVAAEPSLASALRAAKARSLQPLFGKLDAMRLSAFSQASNRFGSRSALSLDKAYRLRIGAGSPEAVARALRASRDVAYAEPNFYVSSLATEPRIVPRHRLERARAMAATLRFGRRELTMRPTSAAPVTLPSNYGLQSSLQSFLNANSIDAVGTYAAFASHSGQLPGQGEIVTNISIGDLTDASMAQNGDQYVQFYGPTTEIVGNQRYLDIPSFPLIPTFTSDMSGNLNPLGSVEGDDPYLSEVLLDFSVMAPLPDSRQRSGAQGSGLTDLLGIAPGAQYRLVVPQQPTIVNIDAALLGAAMQNPKPNVITASLGFGTDTTGFPGRYLEEDPLTEAVIAAVVSHDDTVVCVAANDGTRLYTNAAVNPDGGSTATDIAHGTIQPTSIADDALSTTPGEVFDSGAIAVGGSTLDDIFVAPPEDGGILGSLNAFPETRLDGAINFSSGFGDRVNVSAPSDNIPSMIHQCACGNPVLDPTAVSPVLEGGTSASAPETAAAAAVVLQAARLAGKSLTPLQLRSLLARTGRKLPDPQQLDAKVAVGPQIDLTAAVSALLGSNGASSAQVLRVAIAQRQELGEIGSEFEENTDPSNIDLAGPAVGLVQTLSGQNQFSPITIAPDWYGIPAIAHYALFVTGHAVRPLSTGPWARLMPQAILNAASQPFVSSSARTVSLTYEALVGHHVLAQATFPLTFGANDGTYLESLAPKVPPVVPPGTSFTVNYDLTGVRNLQSPQLIVGSVGHWNPFTAPYFRIVYSAPLAQLKGSLTIPAAVLAEGAGIYGVGIEMNTPQRVVGRFAPLRVSGSSTARPAAPVLALSPYKPSGHYLAVNRMQPGFIVQYDVSSVRGATGAMLELSAPGPTLSALENVFENAFGSMRDDNGTDSASTVYQPLSGLSGSVALDASKLGLTSSLLYNVRVLPVSGGTVVGEASPVSTLEFDDVVAPGGADVSAFDVEPANVGTVSTLSLDGNGSVTESAVYPYQSSSESYGSALVDDTSGADQYYVIGKDTQLGQVGTIEYSPTASGNVQNFVALNATTGAQMANVPLAGGFALALTGRVDGVRHRAAVLEYQFGTIGTTIQPVDLTTETAGAPISAGTRTFSRAGQPNAMDLDPSSGLLYLTAQNEGDNCVILPSGIETIDLGAAIVSPKVSMPTCMAGIASDHVGSSVYLTKGALVSIGPGIAPFASLLVTVQDNPLQLGASNLLSDRACFMPAADPVDHVTLVGCIAPSDYLINNAAMSVIEVIDQNTGTVLKRIPDFNFAYPAGSGIPYVDRGVQLDPATRTGWTYSPFGDALQQFSY